MSQDDNVIKFPKANLRHVDPDDLPDRYFNEARYRISLLEANNKIQQEQVLGAPDYEALEAERSCNYWMLELLRCDPQRMIDWTYEQLYFIQDASEEVEDEYGDDE